jgi:hypothetical protein
LNRVQALIITSHPGPSLAITAVTTLLAAQAARWGPGAVRGVALVLLLTASARGTGRVPFLAALGIAAVDIVLFAAGGEALA